MFPVWYGCPWANCLSRLPAPSPPPCGNEPPVSIRWAVLLAICGPSCCPQLGSASLPSSPTALAPGAGRTGRNDPAEMRRPPGFTGLVENRVRDRSSGGTAETSHERYAHAYFESERPHK